MVYTIAPMTAQHAAAVLSIYQAGLDTGLASFELIAPPWHQWDAAHLPAHRFVALAPTSPVEPDQVLGWVATSRVSDRCTYRGVLEHSVYVHPTAGGRGVGRALLDTLIESVEAAGIWTLQAGIFPENVASVALHRAAGFRTVGVRERIGQRDGHWRDVLLMERRSR